MRRRWRRWLRRLAPPGRVGARSLLADRRQPGRDPARLQRGHPGLPLGGQGDGPGDRLLRPADCAEIEAARTGVGLLVNGGASRANLFSGEAEETILTSSRIERREARQPGLPRLLRQRVQRHPDARALRWEIVLEWTAALRAIRRNVRPRGHRGGMYPLLRAAMCVVVRDLIVYGVLSDMMRGRPAVYATFSSYDEVAHHSGLERADTMEALRKLDQQFGRIEKRARYAARPYRSSCSPTTGRPRAPRSCSGTATRSPTSSTARSRRASVAAASPAATSRTPRPRSRWPRRPARRAKEEQAGREGRLRAPGRSCSAPAISGSST